MLVLIIMNFQSSIQRELDSFFKALMGDNFNINKVTKGAFSKARAKLDPWAFIRLKDIVTTIFYQGTNYKKWHNQFRLVGADGSKVGLPNHPSVKKEFGVQGFGPNADKEQSLAVCSVLYDCLNLMPLDAHIAHSQTGERELLLRHLEHVKETDLLLLDRGYPCLWLLFLLTAKKINFCMRIKKDWWLKIENFYKSEQNDSLVTFELPKKDYAKLDAFPELRDKAITCRLAKVKLDTGEDEILCTSLIDQQEYKQEEFKDLYHCRWAQEEGYKLLKARIEIERFSGKTALAVKQDFHAKILLMALTSAFSFPIEEKVREEYKADERRKHNQKINRTNALATMRKISIPLFLKNCCSKIIGCILHYFDETVRLAREIIRPNRSSPRHHKQKRKYYMNYKPL